MKLQRIVTVVLCTTTFFLMVGSGIDSLGPLRKKINTLISSTGKTSLVGLKVVSLKDNTHLFQKNGTRTLIPASNTKIFTAAASLHILGPDFRFETKFLTDRPRKARIKNLYIKGSGDPTLRVRDLEKMINILQKKGIREIGGDVIIDTSIFDTKSSGPGWAKGDGPIFDKTKVFGLIIDHSCVSVRVSPAPSLFRKPLVITNPGSGFIQLKNSAKTMAGAKNCFLRVLLTNDDTITVKGTFSPKHTKKVYRIAVSDPKLFAILIISKLLKKHKITWKGSIKTGRSPRETQMLAHHYSEPVSLIVKKMMKKSDNLYADALFKRMGAYKYGAPGTWTKGQRAVESFLKKELKSPLKNLALYDGSGLSRANRVSPNHICQLLTYMYKKSPHKKKFIETFPIAGLDGSLYRRMQDKATRLKVKAKTGSLSGVTALSGYIGQQPLIFVSIINRKGLSALPLKESFEDKLCTLLASHAEQKITPIIKKHAHHVR